MTIIFSRLVIFYQIIVCFAVTCLASAHAQPTALLEACNALDDKDKRLTCFKELSSLKSSTERSSAAGEKLKNSFAAIIGAIDSGISLKNYSSLLVESAKELEIFRQESPAPDQGILDLYKDALLSYREAEKVWHASIFKSQDGGVFFGKILNPEKTGLQNIVDKYNLPTSQVLLNTHLPADFALKIIWQNAKERIESANEMLITSASSDLKYHTKSRLQSLPMESSDPLKFQWPASGSILKQFSEKSQGIDIDGSLGDSIVASRGGVVVHISSNQSGYGKFIMIKHDNVFLTAYAHNNEILVKEGDNVKKGQVIAKMGASESDRVKLHFLILQNGKSVNPISYLPK